MYIWYIKIYLKSGVILKGQLECGCASSNEVVNKLFTGNPNAVQGIVSMTGGNLCFLIGEVAAFEIDMKEIE